MALPQYQAAYGQLNVPEYKSNFVDNNIEHTIVDVRTPMEFRTGHIPGAINIPLGQIEHRRNEIPAALPVVVVCATGNRSEFASKELTEIGYSTVYNLQGGTMYWRMHGLPVE